MIIYKLFDTVNFSGKTVVPFNTHMGSRDGGTYKTFREKARGATAGKRRSGFSHFAVLRGSFLRLRFGTASQVLLSLRILQAATAENQAWQRSGRGYSAGMSKIPYLYVAEIGGFELDTNTRERKAARLPNATVPFSYLTYSHENSPMLPIYEKISAFMTNIS